MHSQSQCRRCSKVLFQGLIVAFALAAPSLGLGAPTFADAEYLIDSWETDQGLPENSATAMVQTPEGYLWFGTFNGLVRFDGIKFTVFDPSNTPELPSPGIVNLHLDASRRLWVSTYRGLVVSEPDRWTTFRPVPAWTGNYVRTFSENAGVLCATSFDGKVFQARDGRFEELPRPPGTEGEGYLGSVDRLGGTWVAQGDSVFARWDGRHWQPSDLAATLLPNLRGLTRLRNGNLLLVRSRELVQFDGKQVVSRLALPLVDGLPEVWSANEDHRGAVWICSPRLGLYRVQPSGEVRHFTATNGLTYDGLRFTFEDREHNLWVGSGGGGLMRFKSRRFTAYGQENGLTERNVKAVLEEAPGQILIGTYGMGLFRWEGDRISVPEENRQPFGVYAQCLLRDPDLNMWVGGYAGASTQTCLTILTPTGRRAVSAAESGGWSINALFRDSQGRIWIGGREGVSLFEKGQFTRQSSSNVARLGEVCCFAEDPRRGAVWAAGPEGLNQYTNGQWREIKDAAGRSLNDILCLHGEPDGSLWIGEAGAGLLRLAQGHWSSVTSSQGLPVGNISCIVEDDHGYWWMGSNRGIFRARRSDLIRVADETLANLPCQVFNLSDGLPSVECASGYQSTALKDRQGRIWFATIKGLARVDPAKLEVNTNPPPVRLEGISYLDRAGRLVDLNARKILPATDGIVPDSTPLLTVPPGSSQLEVRFAALSFAAPEKVRLKYRWVQNGKTFLAGEGAGRTVTSQWLPRGHYQLHVTAANNDSVWNEQGATLAFVVQPFYWQTLWFRLLLALGLGGSVAASLGKLHLDRLRRTEELLRQQQALAVERARAAALTQYASDIILLLNAEGRVIYESPSTSRILGYSEGSLLGKNPLEFVHPDDRPTTRLAPQGPERDARPGILVTFRFRHARGHWVELESLATNLLDHPGVQGIMVTMRDLTERKRMEEALRENFHRLELILNTIPGPIWVKDREGRYQAVNLAWLRFFEVELEDVLGKTPRQIFPPEIADRLSREDLEVIATRKHASHIEQMVGAKGSVNWFDTTKVPLEDSSGAIIGTVGVARDITEQKDLEAKLLHAQKMEAVGQLAGGIAHDFNNILAVITLHLALLRENPNVDPQTQDSLAELNHEAQRAANLTRQLLMFSRRSVLEAKVVDLNELVGNLVKMLGRLIGEHIVLRFERHLDLPPVKGDAGMIEQVLMNLAVNARDAMPKGGKLTLSLTPIDADAERIKGKMNVDPGPFICLSVADTGVGMDDAILKRIFEPFFTTKEPGKGTGLGLATVYGIVAQHKGWVDVESEPGQGTTFNVFFPATAKTTPKSIETGRETIVQGQETILLVEDEESVRRVVMQVLRKLGYRVLEAANGPEALKVWREQADHIDLLFTDMMMPEGMTGLDLAEKLRQERPGFKVIISSGYNPEMGREGPSTAGAIIYLQKPYQIDLMSKMIRECLDRH